MSDIQSLLADATELPVADRLDLIEALWETLPDNSLPPLPEAWMAEIQRRSAEYDAGHDAGASRATPWETVRAEALQRLPNGGQTGGTRGR